MDPALKQLLGGDGPDEVEAIIRLDPGAAPPPHVRLVARFGDVATCRLPRDRIAETWSDPGVVSLKAGRPFGVDPEPIAAEEAGSDEGLGESDRRRPEELSATGRGVVVAALDWGLDIAHPNFRRPDGSTRVLALWDQSAPGPGPEPYRYGRVHEREEIDRALAAADPYAALGYHPAAGDPAGRGAHGTHVCDIAAGNGGAPGSPLGVAPEADILFVHLATRGTGGRANLGDSVTFLEALDWVARRAGDRPWVVNASVGKHGGPHTGLTLVEQGIDALLTAAPGRCLVQSGGNYFAADAHASGTLRPGQERVLGWWTDRADLTPNELEVWYPRPDAFALEVRPPDGSEPVRVPLDGEAPIRSGGREVGTVYHRANDPSNGDNHVDIFLSPEAPPGRWEVALTAEDVVDGRFHAWVERDAACPRCQSRLDPGDADPATTTGTICNGFRSIVVGAYDAHSPEQPLAPFSSGGPTRDGRVKPDLVAPGVRVLAARSAPFSGEAPLLTRQSGSSMASPHVAGTVALMFEAAGAPLDIRDTRRLLLSSTRAWTGPREELPRVGSGYLDTAAAVEAAGRFGATGRRADRPPREWFAAAETAGAEAVEAAFTAPSAGPAIVLELVPADPPVECGCRHHEPRGAVMTNARHEISSGPRARAPISGPSGDAVAPAELFDALVWGGPALRAHFEHSFEVVARPGGPLAGPLAAGDVLLERALGEGGLASASLVEEDWDPGPRLPLDQIVVRLRPNGDGESADWPEVLDLGEAVVRGSVAYKRWVQESLNVVMGRRLATDGNLGARSKAAIRSFQASRGIEPDGKMGEVTERALVDALLDAGVAAPLPPGAAALPAACVTVPVAAADPAAAATPFPVGRRDFSGTVTLFSIPVPIVGSVPFRFAVDGTVFYPATSAGTNAPFSTTLAGRAPVVVLAHGNHGTFHNPANRCEETCTDPGGFTAIANHKGYSYFQERLAALGVVAVSVNANRFNCLGLSPDNIALRALLVLAALRHFRSLDTGGDATFGGRLDFTRVGLFGHSRGGEAVIVAARMLGLALLEIPGVTVRGVFSLAPTDTRLVPAPPAGVGFAAMLPAGDGDVRDNSGARFYDQAGPDPFKSQLYVHHTNHNFFNREWVQVERAGSSVRLRSDHEGLLASYGCAFFRRTLLADATMTDFLAGTRLPPDPPLPPALVGRVPVFPLAAHVQTSFEEPGAIVVDDHENRNIDLNTVGGRTARSGGLIAAEHDFSQPFATPHDPFNDSFFGNTVGMVVETESQNGRFRSALAAAVNLTGREIRVRAAEVYNGQNVSGGRTGFLIGLEDDRSRIAWADSDRVGGLPRPFDRRTGDLTSFGRDFTKTMLKTLRFPAACFAGPSGFDLTRVRAILIRLDRRDSRAVAFDQLQIV